MWQTDLERDRTSIGWSTRRLTVYLVALVIPWTGWLNRYLKARDIGYVLNDSHPMVYLMVE